MKAYRTIAAVIAWAALVGQYWLMTKGQPPGEVLVRTVNFFSYFTILTNLLAALALTLPVLAPDSVGRWWGRPAVRGGITVCIAVVMIVYHLVLRGIWEPQGLQKVVDYTLHYVDPLLFILDWLLFAPKGTLRWRNAIGWLAFPAVYGIWTLGHGALSGFYPYPFMDVTALGYPAVLANMAAMVLGFLIPGLLLVGLDGLLGRSARQTA
ncbi:MAG: Pr6Pr family membrane protein [Pseudomonadota bacterium]